MILPRVIGHKEYLQHGVCNQQLAVRISRDEKVTKRFGLRHLLEVDTRNVVVTRLRTARPARAGKQTVFTMQRRGVEPATASGSSLQTLASLELSASFSRTAGFTFTTADEPANEPDEPESNLLLVNQAIEQLTYQPTAAPPEQDLSTLAVDDHRSGDQDIAASIHEQVFEEVGNEL